MTPIDGDEESYSTDYLFVARRRTEFAIAQMQLELADIDQLYAKLKESNPYMTRRIAAIMYYEGRSEPRVIRVPDPDAATPSPPIQGKAREKILTRRSAQRHFQSRT